MKLAVCTLTVGEFYDKLAESSHPTFKAYAKKCGADFHVRKHLSTEIPGYSKLTLINRLLKRYDRVLFVDTDILIRHDAPNLFQLVESKYFAAFNEHDLFPERAKSKELFLEQIGAAPNKAWVGNQDYFNTGVMLVSKCHAEMFSKIPETEVDNFGEQTYLNWRAHELGYQTMQLPHRFNRLIITLRHTGEPLDDSFFIHFAHGFIPEVVDTNYPAWLECAKRFETYRREGTPTFRRRIYVEAAHNAIALGDTVSMEPVVRYLRRELEPEADITIKTFWPEVFAHLAGDPHTTILGPNDTAPDKGHKIIKLMPEKPQVNFNLMHPVDFAALSVFRGHLPIAERGIELAVNCESPVDTSQMVLVHPGKSWQSKTFPRAWWQEVIDRLKKSVQVGIIGKNYGKDDTRGTVAINPAGCLDMRDKTTLAQLIAALAQAGALVSNDSSPIHIAGAFETPVVMITSAKHPDFIWPYREKSLNITLGRPIKAATPVIGGVNNTHIHECNLIELLSVLPEPKEVVAKTLEAYHARIRGTAHASVADPTRRRRHGHSGYPRSVGATESVGHS